MGNGNAHPPPPRPAGVERAPRTTRGYLAVLLAAILFGGVNVAAKVALRDADPLAATAVMFAASGIVFLPFLVSFRPRPKDVPLFLLSATVGGNLAALALFFGLARIPASTASLLLAAEMAFTAVIARVALGERPKARELPGLGLLAAAAVVAAFGQGLGSANDLVGVALVLAATACWGVDNNVNTVLATRYDLRHLVAVRGVVGGALAVLIAFGLGGSFDTPVSTWWLLVGSGIVGIGLSTLVYYAALRDVGATRAVVVFSTSGLWGALAAFLVLAEPLGWHHAGAFALVVGGLAWLWAVQQRASVATTS